MGKIKVLLFSLSVCLLGNNHLSAQNLLPVSGDSNLTSLVIRSSPNSDYILLELTGDKKARPFQIFGMDGKEVYQGRISGTQLIDVSTWNSGTYFVIYGSQREKLMLSK
ncbi:hypothetical protein D3C71_986840 [compost metagenome]